MQRTLTYSASKEAGQVFLFFVSQLLATFSFYTSVCLSFGLSWPEPQDSSPLKSVCLPRIMKFIFGKVHGQICNGEKGGNE